MIDGHPHSVALNRLVEGEPSPGDIEKRVGRHDMDAISKDLHPLRGFLTTSNAARFLNCLMERIFFEGPGCRTST